MIKAIKRFYRDMSPLSIHMNLWVVLPCVPLNLWFYFDSGKIINLIAAAIVAAVVLFNLVVMPIIANGGCSFDVKESGLLPKVSWVVFANGSVRKLHVRKRTSGPKPGETWTLTDYSLFDDDDELYSCGPGYNIIRRLSDNWADFTPEMFAEYKRLEND